MRYGFKVYNICNYFLETNGNSILVDNDEVKNEIVNIRIKYENKYLFKDKNSIGIWKIKKLKK